MSQKGMKQLTIELEQMISSAGVNGLMQSFSQMTKEELFRFVEELGTVRQYLMANNRGR